MSHLPLFPAGTTASDVALRSGLRLRIYERRPEDARVPAVLCLHGFPELALSWAGVMERLGDRARIIAPDLRGYGGSSRPQRVLDYTPDRLRRDILELLDALDLDHVHLVGHDWGGAIAWELAQHNPDRLHTLTIFNCPPIAMMWRKMAYLPQLRRSWYILWFQIPWHARATIQRDAQGFVDRVFRAARDGRALWTGVHRQAFVEAIATGGLEGLHYYRAALLAGPRAMASVPVPTTIVWGLLDPALGPWFSSHTLYAPFVADLRIHTLEGVGHWVQAEALDATCEAIAAQWERR